MFIQKIQIRFLRPRNLKTLVIEKLSSEMRYTSIWYLPFFISLAVLACNIEIDLPGSSTMMNKIMDSIIRNQIKDSSMFGNYTTFLITDNTVVASAMIYTAFIAFRVPLVVLTSGFPPQSTGNLKPSLTIIFLESADDVDEILKKLLAYDNLESNIPIVLIICQQISDVEEHNLSNVFHRVWTYGLHRFIIIYFSNDVHMKRFNPFLQDIYEVTGSKTEIFVNQLWKMHKYKFRVGIFEEWPLIKKNFNTLTHKRVWIGRDVELLKLIMKMENSTFKVIEPPKNTRYKGVISDILNNKTDFCFVKHFLTTPYEGIETSFSDFANLHILVPGPQILSQSKALFKILHIEVWMSFVISLFALGFFMKIVIYFDNLIPSNLSEIFMNIWGIFLNIAIYRIHKYKFAMRISLLFWIWACLILNVSIQSRLMNLLEFIQYEKGIRSFNDLEQSKIPIYTSYNITQLTGNPFLFRNQLRYINYTDLPRLLLHEKPNAAFVVSFGMIRGHTNPNLFPNRRTITHILIRQPLCLSFAVYLFRKNSPFTIPIESRILELKQFGFASKGDRENPAFQTEDMGLQKLNLQQIEAPVLLWVHGIILCFAVMMLEFVLHSPKR